MPILIVVPAYFRERVTRGTAHLHHAADAQRSRSLRTMSGLSGPTEMILSPSRQFHKRLTGVLAQLQPGSQRPHSALRRRISRNATASAASENVRQTSSAVANAFV